ncbi:MAG: hypothetical protein ACLSFT_11500 [Ruminococcus callidus]
MSRSKLFSKNSKRTGNRSHGCRCSCICLPAAESNRYFHLLERHPYLCSLFVCLLLNALYFGGEAYLAQNAVLLETLALLAAGAAVLWRLVRYQPQKKPTVCVSGVYAAGAGWGVCYHEARHLDCGAGRLCCAKRISGSPENGTQPTAAGFTALLGTSFLLKFSTCAIRPLPDGSTMWKIRGRGQPRRLHHLSVAASPAASFDPQGHTILPPALHHMIPPCGCGCRNTCSASAMPRLRSPQTLPVLRHGDRHCLPHSAALPAGGHGCMYRWRWWHFT